MKKIIRDKFRNLSCVACGKTPVDIAHIRSVGAGGVDEEWNLLPACRICHIVQHRVGWFKFMDKYPSIQKALIKKGWEIQDPVGEFGVPKMFHPKLEKDHT